MQLPAERMKVVTMSASLKLYEFDIFFLSMPSKSNSGLSTFQSWKSQMDFTASLEQRAIVISIDLLLSGETNLVLRQFSVSLEFVAGKL